MTLAPLLLFINASLWARGPGTSGAPLFKLTLGARPAAMGGAYVAAADDFNASVWNPGGLAFVPRPAVALSHASLYQGISFDHIAAAAPLGPRAGLGGHFAYMNSGPIDRTAEDQGGSFDAPGSGGQFHDSEFKLDLSAAGAPIDWLGVGGSLDYFRDTVDQNSADGVMMGLGAMARAGVLTYGLSLQNVGPQIRGLDTLPTVLRLGAAARPTDSLLLSAEYDHHFDSLQKAVAFGAEYAFGAAFALRVGALRSEGDGALGTRFSGGFGAAMGSFKFDYAFSPYGEVGNVHQVSLSFHFGSARGKRPKGTFELPPLKTAAELSPEDRFLRADIMLGNKNYPKAKEELGSALAGLAAEDRRRLRYFERMGEIALAENDLDAAQVFFGDGLKLGASLGISDPDVADTYAGMGLCLAAKGSALMGTRFLEKSLEFGPTTKMRAAVEAKLKELKARKK
ncbi:MAG: PorV/PorQ family protein [Elusimicrobia bacterium]|nr:PorV/PorQ family protein [Elusimicrobiota bacterium]